MADNKGNAGYKKPAFSSGFVSAPMPVQNTQSPSKSKGGDLRSK